MTKTFTTALIISPEFERLTKEIYQLRGIIVELLLENNELIYKKRPEMQDLYTRSVGGLEEELHQLRLQSIRLKYITDMIRIRTQLRRKVDISEIEKRADENCAYSEPDKNDEEQNQEVDKKIEAYKKYEDEEIKILYRRIIKLLHPDIGAVDGIAGEKLLKDAIEAYEYKDYQVLKNIATALEELGCDTHIPGHGEDIFRELERKIEFLSEKKRRLEDGIRVLKSEFPLNQEAFLSDPEKVDKRKKKLESGITFEREKVEKLQDKLRYYRMKER